MKSPRHLKQYRPKPHQPCLCGSGIVFARCCAERLPGFEHRERVRENWDSGNYEAALLAARAALCQYAIWHKSNTAPLGHAPIIEKLLKVDIEALSELVGNLCSIHFRLERTEELPAILERTRTLVNDPRWQRKITYHQSLLLSGNGAEDQARKEFTKLFPIDPETEDDLEILQLYLDLFGEKQPFSKKIATCDRIIALSQATSDIVQYRGVKAMAYAGVGDWEEARNQMALSISCAKAKEKERALGPRTRLLLASGLGFLGLLTRDEPNFIEATQILKALLAEKGEWLPNGRAMLWDQLGECYRYWGKWVEGGDAYREALKLQSTTIRSIFLAQCEMHQSNTTTAANLLDAVNFATLTASEQVDFAYTLTELALTLSDRTRLKAAFNILENIQPAEPYFRQRKLDFMLKVQAALTNGPESSIWKTLKDTLSTPLSQINRYLILRPSFMGLGVDFNAVIKDNIEKNKGNNS